MSGWRRLYAKPAGSLPGGVVTQWGVGILALLVLGFLTGWIYLGGGRMRGLHRERNRNRKQRGVFKTGWRRGSRKRFSRRSRAVLRRSGRCGNRRQRRRMELEPGG